MKLGTSLQQIAAELERQNTAKRDFVAKQGAFEMSQSGAIVGINGVLPVTEFAHGQISSALGIPKPYYDRMLKDDKNLLSQNVNAWLKAEPDKRKMVRTLDGKIRAFLSDRYRPLDHLDLFMTALPALQNIGAEVISSEVTETRLYVKALLPSITGTVEEQLGKSKDALVGAIIISNSEIGAGSLKIEAGFYKTRCTNLAIFADAGMKKYHIGRSAVAELDSAIEIFTDETKRIDDKAFWMKVRDVIAATINQQFFDEQWAKMNAAAKDVIVSQDIPKVVEVTRKRLGLADGLQNSLLTHLIQGGDLTRWGILNAVTRTAEDCPNYDEATELERAGGKILELSKNDWKLISEAA